MSVPTGSYDETVAGSLDSELALKMALAAERYYGDYSRIGELKIEAADQLRSENQFLNPFKYTVYSEIIGKEERHLPNRRREFWSIRVQLILGGFCFSRTLRLRAG